MFGASESCRSGHLVLVDNGSTDGTADAVRERHPDVEVVALRDNLGAVGRNIGVRRTRTPYIAFCDDDTWWSPGSLARAADVLDAHPRLALVNARIVVEPTGVEDPIVAELRHSPVPAPGWMPGPALGSSPGRGVGGAAGRVRGGRRLQRAALAGGEEELLATALISAGWELCYLGDLTVHHHASKLRDSTLRRRVGLRNTLWLTWLRRPIGPAVLRTAFLARTVPRIGPHCSGPSTRFAGSGGCWRTAGPARPWWRPG